MNQSVSQSKLVTAERNSLRKRVRQFYRHFNKANWEKCFAMIDPQLTHGKVDLGSYSRSMQAFKDVYRVVNLRWMRLSPHLEPSPKQRDKRPFAYVYVIWQDEAHAFHMFRDRWIKDKDNWFTRVVGLVPNRQESFKDDNK